MFRLKRMEALLTVQAGETGAAVESFFPKSIQLHCDTHTVIGLPLGMWNGSNICMNENQASVSCLSNVGPVQVSEQSLR